MATLASVCFNWSSHHYLPADLSCLFFFSWLDEPRSPLSSPTVALSLHCMQQWLKCKLFIICTGKPSLHLTAHWLFSLNMGGRKKWSTVRRSPFATVRGYLGPRRKGIESLCVSSLLGVLRSHTWLIRGEDVAFLLAQSSSPRYRHRRAHSLSFSFCSSSADGGSDDFGDPRSPSLDPHLSHIGQGKQLNISSPSDNNHLLLFIFFLYKSTVTTLFI